MSSVPRFDDAVDLVIAGHINDEFVCGMDGKFLTMADNNGRLYTDIDVTLDRVTKDMMPAPPSSPKTRWEFLDGGYELEPPWPAGTSLDWRSQRRDGAPCIGQFGRSDATQSLADAQSRDLV